MDYPIEEVGVGMVAKGEWQVEEDRDKDKARTMVIFLEDTNIRNFHYDLY